MTDLPTPPDRTAPRRMPLDRDRVLRAAIRLADRHGLESVSMRKLGQELRVEAMSLYKHVDNKDDIFDGMADLVVSEFEVPADDVDWKSAVRRSAISAHEVLLRHPWAGGLIESRPSAGLARLRYLDATIGVLAAAGFSMPIIRRSIMVLDSYTYGFALQESAWPFEVGTAPQVAATFVRHLPAGDYPNLAAMAESVMDAQDAISPEFAFGLDLILDGLERLRGPVER